MHKTRKNCISLIISFTDSIYGLPILFTKGIVLRKLRDYFSSKEEVVYSNIAREIEEYLKERF